MQKFRLFPFAGNLRDTFPRDLFGSVVVVLVALPLCTGIAIASGLQPAAGIVTGIVGGILVGSLSGCPLQVSGPAAGLAVIVAELVQEHGAAALAAIVVIGGIIQLVAGALKLGQWFRAVPPAVINGMLSGIGALILVSQFHVMLDDTPKGSGINNLLSIPSALWNCLFPSDGINSHIAGGVGLLTIVVFIVWQSIPAKVCKVVPAALVAVVLATLAAAMFNPLVRHVTVPDSLLDVVTVPTVDTLAMIFQWKFILEGLALAFIASADTLLTATAVDRMHQGPRTKYDRELMSQGLENVIRGFLGALPITGVFVRSGVNVHAGARARLST